MVMKIKLILLTLTFSIIQACSESSDDLSTLMVTDIEINEGDVQNTAVISIELSRATDKTISFEVRTSDATAKAGSDYESLEDVIFIEPGETGFEIEIVILGDELVEPNEYFALQFIDPFNVLLDDTQATVTLTNDDEQVFRIPETGATSPESYDGMKLVWQDEFSDNTINETDWTFETGTGNDGWGNWELQYYRKENASIVDGHLVIEAREESFSGSGYTSTRMITQNKQTFQYGRIDIRAVMPRGQGIWPALWMLGNNISEVSWPACGEIDIMEMVGGPESDGTTHGTVHWSSNGQHAQFGGETSLESGAALNDEFHVYSIDWKENSIDWYFDGVKYHSIDTSPGDLDEFREEFFFIFNIAVGGNWPGSPDATTVFPQWMIVDYVRVFQQE